MNTIYKSVGKILILLTTLNAYGDGNHNSKITIFNDSDKKFEVNVFNGKDGVCSYPHKYYKIQPDETKTIKCHGQGKQRCKVEAKHPEGISYFDIYVQGKITSRRRTGCNSAKLVSKNTSLVCSFDKNLYCE